MSTAQPLRPDDRGAVDARSSDSRWRRLLPPAFVAGGLVVATVALHVRDPHEQGTWGECPTKALFGIDCPGCGGLRAVNDLSNLRLVDAASSNLFFLACLPLALYVFARWTIAQWGGRPWAPSGANLNRWAVVLAVLMVGFTILRNTPAGSWLAS